MSKLYDDEEEKKKRESQSKAGSRSSNGLYARLTGAMQHPQGDVTTTPPANPAKKENGLYSRLMNRTAGTQSVGNSRAVALNQKHSEERRKEEVNQPSVKPMASGNLANTQAAKLNSEFKTLTPEEVTELRSKTNIFEPKKYGAAARLEEIEKLAPSDEEIIAMRDYTSNKRYEEALELAIKNKGLTDEEAKRVMASNGSVPYAAYKNYYNEELASPMEKQLQKYGKGEELADKYANAMVTRDLNSAKERADRATTREYEQSRIRNQEDFLARNQYEEDKSYIGNEDYDAVNNNLNAGTISDQLYEGSHLTLEQRQNYNYVYNKAYDEALAKAKEWTSDEEEAQRRAAESAREEGQKYLDMVHADEARTDYFNEFAKEYGEEHPIAATASSIALAPLKVAGQIDNTLNYIAGRPNDENSLANLSSQMSGTMRGTVRNNIDSDAGKFLYDVGTSMGDMAVSHSLGLGSNNATLGIMGASAANDTYTQLMEAGYSATDATVLSAIAGGAEILTEKIPLDEIFSTDKAGFRQMLRAAFSEGAEEVASDVINDVADIVYLDLIKGGESQFDREVQAYMAKGMSEYDARMSVLNDHLNQAVYDFAAGAGSGGALNVMNSVANKAQIEYNQAQAEYNAVKSINDDARKALIELGKTSTDAKTQKLANKISEDSKGLKNIKDTFDTGKVIKSVLNETDVVNQIGEDLADKGVKNVAKAQEVVLKSLGNERLTEEEEEIYQSKEVQSELNDIADGKLDAQQMRTIAINEALNLARNGGKVENTTPTVENTEDGAENDVGEDSKKVTKISEFARNAQMSMPTMAINSIEDIADVVSDDKGRILIETKDGQRHYNPYSQNKMLNNVIRQATNLFDDGAAAKSYIDNYDSSIDMKTYNDMARTMIKAGSEGAGVIESFNALKNKSGVIAYAMTKIPTSFLNDMYTYGANQEKIHSSIVASQEEQNLVNAVGKMFGVNVQITDENAEWNGKFDKGNNTIYVSKHADKAISSVLAHELTHYFMTRTDLGERYKTAVIDYMKEYGFYDSLVKDYKNQGYTDTEIDEEIASDSSEKFMNDPEFAKRMCKNDPSLAKQIISWVKSTIKKLYKLLDSTQPKTAAARALQQNITEYERIRDMWYDAYEATMKADKSAKAISSIDFSKEAYVIKYSFASYMAQDYNKEELIKGEKLLDEGKSYQYIFKNTGWFRGADGKWRFEISDDDMKVYPRGDAKYLNDKDYQRYKELENKLLYGEVSQEEYEGFRDEFDTLFNKYLTKKDLRLDDVITHDKLFKSYPTLRLVRVSFERFNGAKEGAYKPVENKIVVDEKYKMDMKGLKKVLLHEMQHAIQRMESMSPGASVDFYENPLVQVKDTAEYDKYKYLQKEMKSILDSSEDFKNQYEVYDNLLKEFSKTQNESYLDKANKIEEKLYDKYPKLMDRYQNMEFEYMLAKDNLVRKDLASELYYMTAGEIEARDTEDRSELTEEERREKYPTTKTENGVVFSDRLEYEPAEKFSLKPKAEIERLFSKIESHDDSIDYSSNYSVGTLPEIYHNLLGLEPLNLVVSANHLYMNLVSQEEADNNNFTYDENKNHFHKLGVRRAVNLIQKLSDPLEIYINDVKEHKNPRLLVKLTDKYVAALDLFSNNRTADGSSRNNHTTVTIMPMDHKNYLEQYKDRILYKKENQSQSEVSVAKVQGDMKDINSLINSNISEFKQTINDFLKKGDSKSKSNSEKESKKAPVEDSKGRKLSDNQQKFYANCEARDAAGNLQVLYHQTDSDFTEFDTRRAGAGQHDFLTPYGVFLKPTSNDIGLKGKKQMELYANITNMLNVNSRYELENYLKKDADLKEAIDSMKAIDTEYQAKFDEAKKAWTKYIAENSKPGKSLRNDTELERLMDEESEIVEEWGNEYDKRAEKVKAKVDAYLRSQGYDGVHILNDEGSFGRKVETYIAFESNQVKDVNNLNPTENVDIKHSLKADKDEIEKVWQQVKETVPAEIRDEVYKNDKGKGDYSAHQASINTIYYDKNNLKKATRYYDGFAIAYLMEKENYQIPHKPDGEVDYLQIDRDVRNVRNNDRKYGKWLKNLFSDAITENKLTLEDYLKERETTSSDYDVLKIRKLHQDEVVKYAEAYINDELNKEERLKFEQFRLVDKANPPFNDTSYWIRSPKDIMTFEEAINDDSALGMLPIEEGTTYEDLTAEMLQKAKESGIITVYHGGGKGIKNGDFVTPSKMMASEYAGDPSKVYAKTVNLSDVAWLDAEQGMYANRKGAKYSKKSLDDQVKDFREVEHYMPVAESILPLADFFDDYNAIDEGFNMDNAGVIAADIAKGNTTYIDIAKEMYENPYEYAVDDKEAEQIQRIAANAIGAYEEIERAKIEALEKNVGVKYSKKYTDADDDIFFNEDTWENSEAQNSAKNTADILKEGFEELKKLKENGKAHFTHADAVRLAERYQREYGTAMGKEAIANNIESIFAYIEQNRDNIRYDDMLRVMRDAALPIVEKQNAQLDEYNDFRKYIKDLDISLNDSQKAEVINTYGSMKAFRKAIGNRINITENGHNIDSLWQDICEASGYYLDPDENSNTEIIALADAIDSMRDIGDASGMTASEKAYDLALNIYTDYFKLNGVENITKQMKKQIEDYKAANDKMYKQLMDKQKEENNAKLDQLRSELKRLEAEKEIKTLDRMSTAEIDKQLDRYRQRILKLKDEIEVGKVWRKHARLKAAESRQMTILRNRIKNIVDDLSKRVTKPTDTHHVPLGLLNATIDVLQNIDLNTGKSINMAEKLSKLSKAYEAVKDSYGEEINPDYDETLQGMINRLKELFEGRSIAKLTHSELEEVFNICKALQTQIRNTTKLIDSEIKKDVYEAGKSIIQDVRASKGVGDSKFDNLANNYIMTSENAERFFNRISGHKDDSALNKLYEDLNEGQHKMMQIEFDVSDIMKPVLEGKENQKLADKFKGDNTKDWVEIPILDKHGNKIRIPQSMRASLALHMLNEQNLDHIMYGGITFPNEKAYKSGNIADAYAKGEVVRLVNTDKLKEILKKISQADTLEERNELWKEYAEVKKQIEGYAKRKLNDVISEMTPYEQEWVEHAKEYFHDYSGKKINETSIKLNGYTKANIENYFPIRTNSDFTRSEMEGLKLDSTIEGWGNLKNRINSRNPLVLEGLDKVINAHSKMLAKYAGMAIPIRNFNKVYNVTLNGYEDSVKKAIGQKYGKRAQKYISDLFTDLQSSRANDNFLSGLRSGLAKSVLTTNISVAWKQASSYTTAAAELGWDAIIHALGSKSGANLGAEFLTPFNLKRNTKEIMELAEKYTPLLKYRNLGNSTQELGDLKNQKTWLERNKVTGALIDNKVAVGLRNWIQNIDVTTVATLWTASEYRVAKDNPNLEKGSDEFYKEVAKVFNKTVERTQPNYTTLQRPDILRNPNELLKTFMMFKTQPLQNLGILMDATGNLKAKAAAYKASNTAENLAKLQDAKVRMKRAVTSQLVSAMIFSGMTLLAKALYHKMNPYRDEDKELTLESIFNQYWKDVVGSLAGSLPGGSEAWDFTKSLVLGDTWYGFSMSGVDSVTDFLSDLQKLATNEDKKKYTKKVIEDASQVLGVPLKNLENIYEGLELHIKDASKGEFGSFNAGVDYNDADRKKLLYKAMKAGAWNKFDKIYSTLDYDSQIAGGSNSVKSMIKSDYMDGNISYDKAVEYLEEIDFSKEDASKEVSSWSKTDIQDDYKAGKISEEEAEEELVKAGYDKNKAHWTVQEWETGGGVYYDVYSAIDSYDTEAVKAAVKELKQYGYDNSTINAQITQKFKDKYVELYKTDKSEAIELKSAILAYYQAIGKDRETKNKEINEWVK